jgi:hypothetical protein
MKQNGQDTCRIVALKSEAVSLGATVLIAHNSGLLSEGPKNSESNCHEYFQKKKEKISFSKEYDKYFQFLL